MLMDKSLGHHILKIVSLFPTLKDAGHSEYVFKAVSSKAEYLASYVDPESSFC